MKKIALGIYFSGLITFMSLMKIFADNFSEKETTKENIFSLLIFSIWPISIPGYIAWIFIDESRN